MPFIGRVIGVPMTLPWTRSLEELAVLGTFIRFFAERSLTSGAPKVIDNLMLQNRDEPGALRGTPLEFLVSLECREKSFLHGVFGGVIVAQSENGILEKVIAMVVQPTTRVWGFNGGRALWLVHTVYRSWTSRVVHVLVHSKSATIFLIMQ